MLRLIKIRSRHLKYTYSRISISKLSLISLFTCAQLYVDYNYAADAGPAEQKFQSPSRTVKSLATFSSTLLAHQFATKARAGGGDFIGNLTDLLNTLPVVQRPEIGYPIIFREGITFEQAKQLVQYLLQPNIKKEDQDILNFLLSYFKNMQEKKVVTVDFYVNEQKMESPKTKFSQGLFPGRGARSAQGLFEPRETTREERRFPFGEPKPEYLLTLLFEAARLGNLPAAKMLLANNADPLKMVKRTLSLGFHTRFIQNTVWDWADIQSSIRPPEFTDIIRNKDQAILKLLADAGVNPIILLKIILSNISETSTMPLNETKDVSDLCLWVLDLPGVNPNYVTTPNSRPIIFLAIEAGLPDVIQRLIDLGADMNSLYPNLNINPKEYFLKIRESEHFLFKDFDPERLRQMKKVLGAPEVI